MTPKERGESPATSRWLCSANPYYKLRESTVLNIVSESVRASTLPFSILPFCVCVFYKYCIEIHRTRYFHAKRTFLGTKDNRDIRVSKSGESMIWREKARWREQQ